MIRTKRSEEREKHLPEVFKSELPEKSCFSCKREKEHFKNSIPCQKCLLGTKSLWEKKSVRTRRGKNDIISEVQA